MARACVLALLWVLSGCDKDAAPAQTGASKSRGPLGDAAARVNDETISGDEVNRLSAATGVTPRAALQKLVTERLLAQYAASRGYGEHEAVQRMVKQARVQALLAEAVEASGSPSDVEARQQKLEALLEQLRQQTAVRFEEAAIRQAFVDSKP